MHTRTCRMSLLEVVLPAFENKDMGLFPSKLPETKTPRGLLDKPWRYNAKKDTLFTSEYEEELRQSLSKFAVPTTDRVNILLLGPVSAGKSSFINSVATIDNNRYSEPSQSGKGGQSYTQKYAGYEPTERFQNFTMFDTMGVQSINSGFNVKDVMFLVKGHINTDYQFNPASPIQNDNIHFNKTPKMSDRIHCIVYVIDAESLFHPNTPEELTRKTLEMQDRLKEEKIPRVLILTNIDKLSEEVSEDVAMTFKSAEVREAVNRASERFNIPRADIFPVQNYEESPEVSFKLNILILLAMEHMLGLAKMYLKQRMTGVHVEEEGNDD